MEKVVKHTDKMGLAHTITSFGSAFIGGRRLNNPSPLRPTMTTSIAIHVTLSEEYAASWNERPSFYPYQV
jgi:hypothetical protein